MADLDMPAARDFGWTLKPVSSSHFEIVEKPNGQVCVVLNHALLRGVSEEMLRWWFLHFTTLKVRLRDVPGYDGQAVPTYWLWHPVDHHSAELSGQTGPGGTAKPGCNIRIREAMQYDRYGWRYKVDQMLKVFNVGANDWAMGKALPLFGPVMVLRIQFRDVFEGEAHVGVHYHYEVVIGVRGTGPVSRFINRRITGNFGSEFFAAWQRHNVIEVGTFEDFLPAIYAQKDAGALDYAPGMAADVPSPEGQAGHDAALFARRVEAYRGSDDPHGVQALDAPSFL